MKQRHDNKGSDNAPLLGLPVEILQYIIKLAMQEHMLVWDLVMQSPLISLHTSEENHTLRGLSLCCKQLHYVTEPILYSRIARLKLEYTRSAKVDCIYRTLKENESLRPLCKEVILFIDEDPWGNDSPEVYELISWLPNVEFLRWRGPGRRWPPLRTLSTSMPSLRKLELPSYDLSALVHDISGLTTLEILHICAPYSEYTPFSRTVVPANKRGTSLVKELAIEELWWCSLLDLQELLTWPAALKRLSLGSERDRALNRDSVSFFRTTAELATILSVQRENLEAIAFSPAFGWRHLPWDHDFRRFPLLESIWMPFCGLPDKPRELSKAARTICGPRVKKLVLRFVAGSIEGRTWLAPGSEDKLGFFEEMAASALDAGTGLKEIWVWYREEKLKENITYINAGALPSSYEARQEKIEERKSKIISEFKWYTLFGELREKIEKKGVKFIVEPPEISMEQALRNAAE